MSCGHSGNTHPSFEKGLLQRKELKGCGPPATFSPLIPTPTRVTDTREASLNRTPGTPTQAQENSLSSGPSAGTPHLCSLGGWTGDN